MSMGFFAYGSGVLSDRVHNAHADALLQERASTKPVGSKSPRMDSLDMVVIRDKLGELLGRGLVGSQIGVPKCGKACQGAE